MRIFSAAAGHPTVPDIASRGGAFLLDALVFLAAAIAVEGVLPAPAVAAIAFLYLAALPLTPLQGTPGKWIARIKLCDRTGAPLSPRAAIVRAAATVGWIAAAAFVAPHLGPEWTAAFWAVFALPWVSMGILPRRETLFDLVAGTQVARLKAAPETIASAAPAQSFGVRTIAGTLFVWVIFTVLSTIPINAMRDKDRRVRVAYAIGETQPLRDKVMAFRLKEQRWPGADAIGEKEWNPFPAGGGYGLGKEGAIRIRFEVMPELRGKGLTLTPALNPDGKTVQWRCRADGGIERYVPASCR